MQTTHIPVPPGGRRGLSLVEVMVAMTLLLVGLLAVVRQWPLGARMTFLGEFQTEASTIAEQTLESLKASPFPPSSGTRTIGRYTVQWTVSAGPVSTTRLVVIEVRWTWQGRQYAIRMQTIVGAEL